MNLDRLYNLADVREAAQKRLPKGIFEFIDRGAEDDEALAHNREAFRRIKARPQALIDVSERNCEATMLGERFAMPLAIAPTGAAGLVWYQGEMELAKAAAATGIPFTIATRSMSSLEEIVALGGTLWYQLYVFTDRAQTWKLIDRVARSGAKALLVTADVPVQPNREFNRRNGYTFPFKATPRSVIDMLRHPRWLIEVIGKYQRTTGIPQYEKMPEYAENLTFEDIRELRRRWPGQLLVKGILRADDAVKAVDCGADGIVVSNHGGRCLDVAAAPIDVLPQIVDAVGHRASVLMDSGVRRGSDIAKAVSFGAQGVLSGRPGLLGLSLAGQAGAEHVLGILRRELLIAMGQLGCAKLSDLGPHLFEHPALVPSGSRQHA
ncbi:MAG: alpha-hydroxy-acid oxidizing protein [Betaproteobacteria bacterium]|nr:alpha-hydroxy-acid oxidizing protein [Betaproteobacteria bacterium]